MERSNRLGEPSSPTELMLDDADGRAQSEGYRARRLDRTPRAANPYPATEPYLRDAWDEGWNDADLEDG